MREHLLLLTHFDNFDFLNVLYFLEICQTLTFDTKSSQICILNIFMAIFIDVWPSLFKTKVICSSEVTLTKILAQMLFGMTKKK